MAELEYNGAAQPAQSDTYKVSGNQVSKQPNELEESNMSSRNDNITGKRTIQQQISPIENATTSSLARGVEGAPPGEERQGKTHEDVGRHNELNADQMAAPGEGEVWRAVEGERNKAGSGGEQPDFVSDLERKKAEQAPLRSNMNEKKAKEINVGGILGQRGGPASSVD